MNQSADHQEWWNDTLERTSQATEVEMSDVIWRDTYLLIRERGIRFVEWFPVQSRISTYYSFHTLRVGSRVFELQEWPPKMHMQLHNELYWLVPYYVMGVGAEEDFEADMGTWEPTDEIEHGYDNIVTDISSGGPQLYRTTTSVPAIMINYKIAAGFRTKQMRDLAYGKLLMNNLETTRDIPLRAQTCFKKPKPVVHPFHVSGYSTMSSVDRAVHRVHKRMLRRHLDPDCDN
tara:strand:- start:1420 stop:2115 length:696 start_codon:yes stop_codon:yes gene_type:complete